MRVLKIGGAVCQDPEILDKLETAWRLNRQPTVLIHGGGPQLTAAIADLGEAPIRVRGLRVTSEKAAGQVLQTMDQIGQQLVKTLRQRGVDVRHIPASMNHLQGVSKDPEALGRVGTATGYDGPKPGNEWLVITPVASDAQGPLNVNADEAAATIAGALGATHLDLISDVEGVRGADGTAVSELTAAQAVAWMQNGIAAGGMVPKLEAALAARSMGVQNVRIGNLDLLQPHAAGTALVNA